jgi:hypothetical protein
MNRIVALATFWIAAVPGFAQQLQVNFDPAAHFSRYKTYRLVQATGLSSKAFPVGFGERIVGLVEERLAADGLRPVATGGDLMICYNVHITEHPQKINLSDGAGPTGLGWGDATYFAILPTIYEWTLTVNIVDAKQNHVVFEGVKSQTTGSTPARNAKKLTKAFHEILDRYPPQAYVMNYGSR